MRWLAVHDAHHLHSLFNGMHDGLFDIGVLAGIHGVDQHLFVPVVRAANQDGINILAVKNFVIVRVSLGAWAGDFQGFGAGGRVDIADGHELDAGTFLKQLHDVASAMPASQHADANAVVRAQHPRRRQIRPARLRRRRQGPCPSEIPAA